MTLISDSTSSTTPTLLVFERTLKGRQRASWFTAEDADEAEQAAKPMGYTMLPVTDEAGPQLVAAQLPRGQYTRDGGAGVPFVARERLNRVLRAIAPDLADPIVETNHAPTENKVVRIHPRATVPVLIDVSTNPAPSAPSDWDEIKPGSVVLARDHHQEAWYEAVVLNVIGDVCRLRWRDYPGERIQTCRRNQLGLLYPNSSSKSAA
ncbi:hypothetical protein [Microvirga aerophila]|uniref:Uncharacterized protein n=1 Tax=Microvirga aerophila TaxID=670291 RepID=A0A512C0R0_9HYPH|nr:hypothetical protein [Microvirga aerophila]GEO17792.1 hypothetical protein MAE02_54880 [Microvirga aerophila]